MSKSQHAKPELYFNVVGWGGIMAGPMYRFLGAPYRDPKEIRLAITDKEGKEAFVAPHPETATLMMFNALLNNWQVDPSKVRVG